MHRRQVGYRTALAASVSFSIMMAVGLRSQAVAGQDSEQAPAQEVEAAKQTGFVVEEVLVTAQRRKEQASDVPVSIVAFGADTIQKRVVISEQDLGYIVPGLYVKSGQNSNQVSFSMRGQTLDPFSGTSPAVLTYLNEAPFSVGNTASSFFDMSAIEVLKGPQGTLFGRNATGGAVLYSTPIPGDELGGYLTARVAERNLVNIQLGLDLPLVPGKLSVRLAGERTSSDGYIRNINTGNTLGDKDTKSGRITVQFTPTDTITNTFLFQHSDIGGTEGVGGLYSYYLSGATTPNGRPLTTTLDSVYGPNSVIGWNADGPAGPGTWPGGVAGYLEFQQANPYDIWLQYDLPHKAHATFLSDTLTVDLNDNLIFKNIFSFTDAFSRTPGNLAGGPFGALWLFNFPGSTGLGDGPPGGETFDNRVWTEEVQLQGNAFDNQLDYILGVFYSERRQVDYIPVNVGADLPTPLADIAYHYRINNDSTALFGQLTYHMTDALKVAVGGRYSWESVAINQLPGSLFAGSMEQNRKLSAPSWTFNIQYFIDPENMVYFAQRGSFRSGNFNGTVVPFNDINFFKKETSYDFEVGYKFNGTLMNMPAVFNIAAYQQYVEDAQHAIYTLVQGNPAGFTVNVPKARVRGIEIDSQFVLNDMLMFGVSGAYTDAEYTNNIVPLANFTGIPGDTITFDTYPDAPKWSGSAFVEVKLPVSEQYGDVRLRGDVFGQTKHFFSNNGKSFTPGTQLKGYVKADFRLEWNDIGGGPVSAAAYLKNAFDKFYYVTGYVMGGAGGYNTAIPGEPRVFGGELSVTF